MTRPFLLAELGPCLGVWKPAGLLTQAPPGIDSLELRLRSWLKAREGKAGNIYLGLPHRLDRPVSGAMVFARHVRAARRLAEQFEGRSVRKFYWAVVEGQVMPNRATWRDFLRKVPDEARAELVPEGHPDGREAILHYRVLGRFAGGTWLEIELETGRTHQIRVQAAARGHPVMGDVQYGATGLFGPAAADPREQPIALHGRLLEFRHPMTQATVCLLAPLDEPWRALDLPLGPDLFLPTERIEVL